MNVRLLRRIARKFARYPRRVNMDSFADYDTTAPCKTTACIAGEALLISGWKFVIQTKPRLSLTWVRPSGDTSVVNEAIEAGRLLDLDPDCYCRLFFLNDWPPSFADRYSTARTRAARTKVVVERINHFIETDGRE